MAADSMQVMQLAFLHLVMSQISSRGLTFVLNWLSTRLLTPEDYGMAAVQFHLINTTILFLSREGFRRGCLRGKQDTAGGPATGQLLCTAALCWPLGVAVTMLVCAVALRGSGSGQDSAYITAVWIQGAAALVELAAEPLYILAQCRLLFRLRLAVDAAAQLAKCVTTLALLAAGRLPVPVALSLSQLAFGGATLLGYAAYYAPAAIAAAVQSRSAKPFESSGPAEQAQQCAAAATAEAKSQAGTRNVAQAQEPPAAAGTTRKRPAASRQAGQDSGPIISEAAAFSQGATASAQPGQPVWLPDTATLWLVGSFSLQAAEKLALAEGSKVAMVALASGYAQGVYGLVANLGSLAVRLLLQPFEEAAFLAFARPAEGAGEGSLRGKGQTLTLMVRCVLTLGLLAVAFGPAYSYVLLRVLYSTTWSETQAPVALGVYCLYFLCMAVNGTLEACVHAAATARQLVQINVFLVVFAVAHVAMSMLLVAYGGVIGLILADSANMGLRITYSLHFVRIYFRSTPSFKLAAFMPSQQVLAAMATALVTTGCSDVLFMGRVSWLAKLTGVSSMPGHAAIAAVGFWPRAACHVAVGAVCCVGVLWRVFLSERQMVSQLKTVRALRTHPEPAQVTKLD